ncbi:N-acetyltransferase NAT13 [Exidia glandulosa HHB12029]|uniref:N-acetyltransferase NAT13 n=1 Tax=Exidia glandulosa HHB12029 TaxID=1314781 RepID=A0A165F088_EXIGL|nr:N-acetyltransferase NAT13 [Exidia glandulosa HHB12029]
MSSAAQPSAAAKTSNARVSLSPCTLNNLGTVRKLNSVLFPIRYAERFYKDILLPEAEHYCQLLYYNDIPVGTVCCRIENDAASGASKLYIMTMGVLAPYRGLGLGARCLTQVLEAASAATKPRIKSIYLHVQVSNEHARGFYEHHGFKVSHLFENYYKKIEPRDAWVLEREVDAPPAST